MTDAMTRRLLKWDKKPVESKEQSSRIPVSKVETVLDSDEESPFEKSEFVCYDNTIIKFGKLKGKMHSDLLKPENINYANWILNQNNNDKFYYKATCKYLQKRLRPTDQNLDITSTDYLYLIDKVNPTEEEKKRIQYFENNLNSHFVKLSDCE